MTELCIELELGMGRVSLGRGGCMGLWGGETSGPKRVGGAGESGQSPGRAEAAMQKGCRRDAECSVRFLKRPGAWLPGEGDCSGSWPPGRGVVWWGEGRGTGVTVKHAGGNEVRGGEWGAGGGMSSHVRGEGQTQIGSRLCGNEERIGSEPWGRRAGEVGRGCG